MAESFDNVLVDVKDDDMPHTHTHTHKHIMTPRQSSSSSSSPSPRPITTPSHQPCGLSVLEAQKTLQQECHQLGRQIETIFGRLASTTTTTPSQCTHCQTLSLENEKLKQQLVQLEIKFDQHLQGWTSFKQWWLSALEKRGKKKRRKLNDQEKKLFEKVGIDAVQLQDDADNDNDDDASEPVVRLGPSTPKQHPSSTARKIPWTTSAATCKQPLVVTPIAGKENNVEFAQTVPSSKTAASRSKMTASVATPTRRSCLTASKDSLGSNRAKEINHAASAKSSKLASYTIDPAQNFGETHLFKAVERNRSKRKQLPAADCDCCRDYYEQIGDLGVKQRVSRHREFGLPNRTPPGYWNIQFPSTQEAEEINRLADTERERRAGEMERDPRFIKKS